MASAWLASVALGLSASFAAARTGSNDQRPWAVGGVVRRERNTAPVWKRRCVRAVSGFAMYALSG